MSGAHWFTDIAVGSVSMVCVGSSWIHLTPLGKRLISAVENILPLGWSGKQN